MNKKELAKALKPLIKECIREVVFEEKFLSNIISEVVQATTQVELVTETKHSPAPPPTPSPSRAKLEDTRKRMMEAVGRGGYSGVDLFEGTDPLKSAGTPKGDPSPGNPLDIYAPDDPGVNISGLFSAAGHKWNRLK